MTPAVSILITTYERERYVAASIESVLAQTFTDFELLVVDDASRDATAAVAQRYATDPRVQVVVGERHRGQFANRNFAATFARGQFLKFHDSDDLMYPHCLATLVPLLAAEPRAAFAMSGHKSWPGGPYPMLLTPRMCYQREFLGRGLFMCSPASALFRTEAFRALGGFPEDGAHSDGLFWLDACRRHHALLVPADLYWWRVHSGQSHRSERSRRDAAQLVGTIWRALGATDCPLDAAEREQAKRNWVYAVARDAYHDARAGRFDLVALRLRSIGLTWRDWLRYLRRPRREPRAGTPLDERGDYLIPDWCRPGQPAPIDSSVPDGGEPKDAAAPPAATRAR